MLGSFGGHGKGGKGGGFGCMRNVRRFKPVSANVFCEVLKAFLDLQRARTRTQQIDVQASVLLEAALHLVARKGSRAALRKLLNFGVYIEREKRLRERKGLHSGLRVCAFFGHAAIVETLFSLSGRRIATKGGREV